MKILKIPYVIKCVGAFALSACGPANNSKSESDGVTDPVVEQPARVEEEMLSSAPSSTILIGGVANGFDFSANSVGHRLRDTAYMVDATSEYVEVSSEKGRPRVGPRDLLEINPGALYEVEAVIERLEAGVDAEPAIVAWTFDANEKPFESNRSVRSFPAENAPFGEVVTLKAQFSTEVIRGSRQLAGGDLAKFVRFGVSPYNSSATNGERSRVYSVTVSKVSR